MLKGGLISATPNSRVVFINVNIALRYNDALSANESNDRIVRASPSEIPETNRDTRPNRFRSDETIKPFLVRLSTRVALGQKPDETRNSDSFSSFSGSASVTIFFLCIPLFNIRIYPLAVSSGDGDEAAKNRAGHGRDNYPGNHVRTVSERSSKKVKDKKRKAKSTFQASVTLHSPDSFDVPSLYTVRGRKGTRDGTARDFHSFFRIFCPLLSAQRLVTR